MESKSVVILLQIMLWNFWLRLVRYETCYEINICSFLAIELAMEFKIVVCGYAIEIRNNFVTKFEPQLNFVANLL